ncbi:MAG: phosphoenolpyruvate carboxylase, partial [Candidatus Eisenbacteria bacterium]|nr:phosphoenolpyruvate carboxylase [Candidatus Eisenbacteria bacterium]
MSQPSRRQTLAPHHEPLRVDVGYLGNLLGEVLRDQGGLELYEAVEEARLACISRREKGESPKTLLGDFSDLSVDQATLLVRAFATYFSLTNLAEQVHRTRRRRDYQFEERAQPGSLEAVFSSFKHIDPTRLRDAIDQLSITPVFTAHPTEAIRRTILKKEQRIARALVDRIEMPQRTPVEDHRITEQIRAEVGLIWQTAGQASTRPTVADEVEHILFFLTEVIYRVVPPFREKLEKVAAYYLGSGVVSEKPLVPVRFGSWVGGDMDGNPNVGADTVLATLRRQRSLILHKYRTEVRTLFEHLSQSDARVGISKAILEKTAEYKKQFPSTLGDIPARYHEMPYRSLLWMVWHRLGLTETQEAGGYPAPEALIDDLEIIDQSLTENQGARAGRHLVRRLLTRVRTFGFHLAMLDLRQDAELHRTVLAEYLGDEEFASRDAKERTRLLEEALEKPLKTQASPSEDLSKTLDV